MPTRRPRIAVRGAIPFILVLFGLASFARTAWFGGRDGTRPSEERFQAPQDKRTVPAPQSAMAIKRGEVFLIEDFNNKVTRAQLGFNYFGGTTRVVESTPGFADIRVVPRGPEDWRLRLDYDFRDQKGTGHFAGLSFTLLGPTEGKVDLDGNGKEPESSIRFRDRFMNATDFFQALPQWQRHRIDELGFDVEVEAPLTLKVELQSDDGIDKPRKTVFKRITIQPGQCRAIKLAIPGDFAVEKGAFDWSRLSVISILVEKEEPADRVANSNRGYLLIDNLQLVDSNGSYPDFEVMRGKPQYRQAFLEYARALTFLYFLDFVGTDPRSGGIIQDRGTHPDELSVAGAGFQLTAYTIAVEVGYLRREDAARRSLRILDVLHRGPQGPDRVGMIGYRGFFYRSLSLDGRRKLFFHRKGAGQNDLLSTTELSTIDMGLFLCGALTAAQYFDAKNETESAIRKLANDIYARVDWPFMHDKESNQMILGWTPNENRRDDLPGTSRFRVPDREGFGHFASKRVNDVEVPATFDYYTDEGVLIALLACASPRPEHRLDPSVFFSMKREGKPFVRTYPGCLFTYQFASCWLDTAALGPDADPRQQSVPINYFKNSRDAILATIKYASDNPLGHKTLGRTCWGLSACQGPFGSYFPEAAPPVSLAKEAGCADSKGGWHLHSLEHGTVAPYAIGCSLLHCPEESIAGLWECQRLGMLHPRFGFADAFNREIADGVTKCLDKSDPAILRTAGPWRNQMNFAIDQGPLLVIIDNYLRDRFVPRTFTSHPQIRATLTRLFPMWNAEKQRLR